MGELNVNIGSDAYSFGAEPDRVVTVGRSADNDVVVADPTVSRHHARLSWNGADWVWVNLASAVSFRSGQSVTKVVVSQPIELALASPSGPVVRLHPAGRDAAIDDAARTVPARTTSGPRAAPTKAELVSAFHILVPVKSWLSDPGWRQRLRLAMIPYALLPLLFIVLFRHSGNLTTPGWAYSLYIAPLWVFAFWLLIRPGSIGRREVEIGIGVVVWVLIWMKAVTVHINGHLVTLGTASINGQTIRYPKSFSLVNALGVGFNEEITKALPIFVAAIVVLKWRKMKLGLRMWMFLGTIAGLTFGVAEQANYTSHAIVNIAQAQSNSDAVISILLFAERVFVDGFQHAIWAAISAFFVGMAVNYPRRRVELLIFAVSVPAVLHGVNDWVAPHEWVWVAVQALSLLMFLGYTMSARSIEREVRRTPMFRGDSMLVDDVSVDSESQPAGTPWSTILGAEVKVRRAGQGGRRDG